jgi:hypothetical protein
MSSSSRSLDEGIPNVGLPRLPDPCIFTNREQFVGEETGLVLPTSREIQDAWEEVAGREQEPEAEKHAEEETQAEEDPGANEDAGAEEMHSTPPITGSYLQSTISADIDSLFSPINLERFRVEYNLEPVATKKRKPTRGAIGGGGTTTTRAKGKGTQGRSRKRG